MVGVPSSGHGRPAGDSASNSGTLVAVRRVSSRQPSAYTRVAAPHAATSTRGAVWSTNRPVTTSLVATTTATSMRSAHRPRPRRAPGTAARSAARDLAQFAYPAVHAQVGDRLTDRRERAGRRRVVGARGLHGPAHAVHQRRGQAQAEGGDDEAGVRADRRRQYAAQRGTDHGHRAPRRAT